MTDLQIIKEIKKEINSRLRDERINIELKKEKTIKLNENGYVVNNKKKGFYHEFSGNY